MFMEFKHYRSLSSVESCLKLPHVSHHTINLIIQNVLKDIICNMSALKWLKTKRPLLDIYILELCTSLLPVFKTMFKPKETHKIAETTTPYYILCFTVASIIKSIACFIKVVQLPPHLHRISLFKVAEHCLSYNMLSNHRLFSWMMSLRCNSKMLAVLFIFPLRSEHR